MRILICNWRDLSHPYAGGAERFTHEVASRWVLAGHQVTQFCAGVPSLVEHDVRDGVRIVRRGSRMGVYRAARHWYREHGRGQFDLVIDEVNTRPFQCHRWVTDAAVVALAHQVCREIWFAHMNPIVAAAGRWVAEPLWLRGLATNSVPVLTVSASSEQSLRDYGIADVSVVGIGCDARPRPDVPRELRPTLVFLGRLSANKSPAEALIAHRLLRKVMPDVQMWVIGDGPERAKLQRRFGDTAQFFGHLPIQQRDERLARAHAALVTSVREGWALVVDEAAAMGTPVAAYDRPGLRDSVPPAGGVLVAPNPQSLAAALLQRLPAWTATPAAEGWRGGAQSWDRVAVSLLDSACRRAGISRARQNP